jgi:hypothetical protein
LYSLFSKAKNLDNEDSLIQGEDYPEVYVLKEQCGCGGSYLPKSYSVKDVALPKMQDGVVQTIEGKCSLCSATRAFRFLQCKSDPGYVLGNLLREPGLSVETLVERFSEGVYKPAVEGIRFRSFQELLDKLSVRKDSNQHTLVLRRSSITVRHAEHL